MNSYISAHEKIKDEPNYCGVIIELFNLGILENDNWYINSDETDDDLIRDWIDIHINMTICFK